MRIVAGFYNGHRINSAYINGHRIIFEEEGIKFKLDAERLLFEDPSDVNIKSFLTNALICTIFEKCIESSTSTTVLPSVDLMIEDNTIIDDGSDTTLRSVTSKSFEANESVFDTNSYGKLSISFRLCGSGDMLMTDQSELSVKDVQEVIPSPVSTMMDSYSSSISVATPIDVTNSWLLARYDARTSTYNIVEFDILTQRSFNIDATGSIYVADATVDTTISTSGIVVSDQSELFVHEGVELDASDDSVEIAEDAYITPTSQVNLYSESDVDDVFDGLGNFEGLIQRDILIDGDATLDESNITVESLQTIPASSTSFDILDDNSSVSLQVTGEYVPSVPDGNYIAFYGIDVELTTTTGGKLWDGIIEYSFNNEVWYEWNGELLAPYSNVIYLRGTNNTTITGNFLTAEDLADIDSYVPNHFVTSSSGFDVYVSGDLRNLLDYQSVARVEDPDMIDYAFSYWLYNQDNIVQAPYIDGYLGTTYGNMMFAFSGTFISNIEYVARPSTDELIGKDWALAPYAFYGWCKNCSHLTSMTFCDNDQPSFPESICQQAFMGCTLLSDVQFPRYRANSTGLPAVVTGHILQINCLKSMFEGCTSLQRLVYFSANNKYYSGSLSRMYAGCTSVELSTTATSYLYSITSGALMDGATETTVLSDMFLGTTGVFAVSGTPAFSTTYYTLVPSYQYNQVSIYDENDELITFSSGAANPYWTSSTAVPSLILYYLTKPGYFFDYWANSEGTRQIYVYDGIRLYPSWSDEADIECKFTNTSGVTLNFYQLSSYTVIVDWGDGNSQIAPNYGANQLTHTYYDSLSTHTVKLRGQTSRNNLTWTPCNNANGYTFVNNLYRISGSTISYNDNRTLTEVKYNNGSNIYYGSESNPSWNKGYMFAHCVNLTKFTFGHGFTTIPKGMCYEAGLTTLNLGDSSFTSIGDSAFYKCKIASNISFPSSLTSIGSSSFYYCNLPEIYIPDSVTSIGSNAFRNCTSVTSITLGKNVSSIGTGAFMNTSSRTSIVVDSQNTTYTSLGSNKYLIEIATGTLLLGTVSGEIPNDSTVTIIGKYAFAQLGVQLVTIPNQITTIDDNAFRNCTGLTRMIIGSNVSSVGSYAFYECSSLSRVSFASIENWCKVVLTSAYSCPTYYGATIYDGNIQITSLVIPSSITSLSNHLFRGCKGLTSVSLNNVTTVGTYCFENCADLTSITIPDTTTTLGDYCFQNCTSLDYVYFTDNWNGSNYGFFDSCASITTISIGSPSSTVMNLFVDSMTSIQHVIIRNAGSATNVGGFSGYTALIDISIPTGITTVDSQAFQNCSALTTISIPDTISEIGANAFSGCTSLTYNVYDNAKYLGNTTNSYVALISCIDLTATSCNINSSTTCLSSSCFDQATGLTSIIIPSGVLGVGSFSFRGCTSLTLISLPNSVIKLGSGAFQNCSNLNNVTLSSNITSILDDTFRSCSSLSNINIPNSVTGIGSGAFASSGLTSIYIPASVEFIGSKSTVSFTSSSAFAYCDNLVTMEVDPQNTTYYSQTNCILLLSDHSVQFGCVGSVIPVDSNVTTLAWYSFQGANLSTITIPSNITNISYAFQSAMLQTIIVPSSVTDVSDAFAYCSQLASADIGSAVITMNGAFSQCSSLMSLTCRANTPPTVNTATFSAVPSNCDIYVPAASVSTYQSANIWSDRSTYIQAIQ